uniref:Core shell protein Gag P30 domain-containing protein n=1 Tax=Phasianus colchicus TaxID=9054 RepID=A0A669QIP6_PHACC
MEGTPWIPRGSPLEELLSNWGQLEGTAGLSPKRAVTLCQDDWPFLTRVRGAGPDEVWPAEGSFQEKRLTTLRKILQDRNPYQMDYLFLWINWADKRKKVKIQKVANKQDISEEAGQFPMVVEFHSNPRVGPNTAADVPPLVAVSVHQPWKPGDLLLWQERFPRLRDNAEKCAKMLSSIIRDYKPNWEDMQTLLQELFTTEERERILAKDRELSNNQQGRPTWPVQDPSWEIHTHDGMEAWKSATNGLLEAIRACEERVTNWARVQECQQRLGEHPSDYWQRLRATLIQYGGMTEQTFQEPLAISVFVNQAAPDISKYFKKHMPGWQGENLQKILSVASFVYNGRDQEKKIKLEKEKEEEKKRLEKQLERAVRGRGLIRGRRQLGTKLDLNSKTMKLNFLGNVLAVEKEPKQKQEIPVELKEIPKEFWSRNSQEIGFLKSAKPVEIKTKEGPPPSVKQYPI